MRATVRNPTGGPHLVLYDFLSDPILGPAFDYWQAKCGARAMPRRRDIDPVDIPRLLPNVQITELIDGGARIRYRLVGTAIVNAYGAELTGKHFDQVFSGSRLEHVQANYRTIRIEKRPLLVCSRYVSARNADLFCARLVMPLSEDGVDVNQCLTAMSFHFPSEVSRSSGGSFGSSNFDLGNSYSEIIR
jgi:hypothetical protein